MGGDLFLDRYLKRFPKHEPVIQRNFELLRTRGAAGIFISKLIPMIRTIISIPAGVIRMNFVKYTISSALGIFVWNFFLIGAGYVMGDMCFSCYHQKEAHEYCNVYQQLQTIYRRSADFH